MSAAVHGVPGAYAECAARPPAAPRQTWFLLQRDGQRPLRFRGELLAATKPASSMRLALYCGEDGDFVAELRCTALDATMRTCHAVRLPTLNDAILWFENVAPGVSDGAPPPPDAQADALFLAAARLCRDTALEVALRHAIGGFLYQLAAAQNPDLKSKPTIVL